MKKKNNKKWVLVLVLLLVVSIGYAALASNLKINGTTGVKSATWDVYWNNVQVTQGSVATTQGNQARITDQKKTQVEYSVTLNEPGDFYEFTVDAVNNGTIDAMIASEGIVNGVYSDANYQNEVTLPDAIKYSVTYADGTTIEPKHLLARKNGNTPTTETYKVRIEYRNDNDVDPEDLEEVTDQTYYFKFSVNYVQADKTAEPSHVSAIHYVTRQNEGQITPGDVIGIGETEDFFVVSSNSEKTVLLAKYNLMVGDVFENNQLVKRMNPSNTQGYGLQSADIVCIYNGYDNMVGTVQFSPEQYWNDGNGLLSPYNVNGASYDGNPYPYVYNSSMITEPDFSNECDYSTNCWDTPGYSIAYYVEQYVTALKGMGAPSTITGRLISYEEVEEIGEKLNNMYNEAESNLSQAESDIETYAYDMEYYASEMENAETDEDYGWAQDMYQDAQIHYQEALLAYQEAQPVFHDLELSYNQYFWTGSAFDDSMILRVGEFHYDGLLGFFDSNGYGVRPVIEIPTSELQ